MKNDHKRAETTAVVECNFEQLLVALEEIIKNMESGTLSMEASIKSFEDGVDLLNKCQNILKNAEQKVQILASDDRSTELQRYTQSK